MIYRLIIIIIVVLCTHLQCIAQEEDTTVIIEDEKTHKKQTIKAEDAAEETPPEQEERVQHSLSFQVLGRELTRRERESFGNGDTLSRQDLNNILAGEQRLVAVRALTAVNSVDYTADFLQIYHFSQVQTYSELVDRFNRLTEKYGSVKAGIESEYVYNIKDDKEAFKKAAFKAYETVFGVPEDKQNKDQILTFLTQSKALTYSKMVETLMQTITPEVKKQILFNSLDQIGRSDLKTNDKFINKILEKDFTYQQLMGLLKKLKQTAPAAKPAQGKNLQIQN